jgi:hypothetical protein
MSFKLCIITLAIVLVAVANGDCPGGTLEVVHSGNACPQASQTQQLCAVSDGIMCVF